MPVKPIREPDPLSTARRQRGAERRTETRLPASGEIRLRQSGILAGSFVGRLVDIADNGFRVRHRRLNLASGEVVDFEFADRAGRACAVWTQIAGTEAETGFRILGASGD